MGKGLPNDPVVCCRCRDEVTKPSGWCENCDRFPCNVTPRRFCERNHPVDIDGFCWECREFIQRPLQYTPTGWVDGGAIRTLLSKEENQRRARELAETLSGSGWPEKDVPLNRQFIPRRWKRAALRVVGMTPNGDDIVIPDPNQPASLLSLSSRQGAETPAPTTHRKSHSTPSRSFLPLLASLTPRTVNPVPALL